MNYETSVIAARDDLDTDPTTNRNKTAWIIAAVVVILASAAGAYYFMSKPVGGAAAADAGKDSQAQTVTVIAPGSGMVVSAINATGTLAARREIPVGVVGEGGQVARVFVDAGDWVKQGQVLVSSFSSPDGAYGRNLPRL